MTAPQTPAPLLDRAAFEALVETIARRDRDPEAARQVEADPAMAPVFASYRAALATYARQFQYGVSGFGRSEDAQRTAAIRMRLNDLRARPEFRAVAGGPFTRELALAFGEISRLADLDAAALQSQPVVGDVVSPRVAERLGAEVGLVALHPQLRAVADAVFRHRRAPLTAAQEGYSAEFVTRMIDRLGALQKNLTGDAERRATKANIGPSFLPSMAGALATATVLQPSELPALFQHAYDKRWHTMPRTKAPAGALVHEVRTRAGADGAEELLVVLAASSDGTNRAVAGYSERTPLPVYDKMIYDNSLAVLSGVVQNRRHFNNHKAYAMLDTGLAPQTIAVMKLGAVDMGIRVLACERAIAHEGVDPIHVYDFLRDHTTNENVPQSLWRDFIVEMQRRLVMARVHGTPEVIEAFEGRVTRFTTLFMDQVLTPYWRAKKEILRYEETGTTPPSWMRKALQEHKTFIGAHEFAGDGALMNILVEGARAPKALQQLLQHYTEARVPLTPEMIVAIFGNSDPKVREQGMQLLPNVSEEEVERLKVEIAARVQADRDSVKTQVFTNVIPEYEPIEGVERKLSRMHHHFDAATIIAKDDLINTFVQCAERDPRTIPDEFARLTARARSEARIKAQLDVAETAPTESAPLSPMVQDELFAETRPGSPKR